MSYGKDRAGFYRVRNEHGHTICRDIEDEHTARLHDAAPRMLTFLKEFACNGGCGKVIDWRNEARAILREIEGKETP